MATLNVGIVPRSVSSTSVKLCACSECPVSGLRPRHLEGNSKVRKGPFVAERHKLHRWMSAFEAISPIKTVSSLIPLVT